jgi:hypothetical protein
MFLLIIIFLLDAGIIFILIAESEILPEGDAPDIDFGWWGRHLLVAGILVDLYELFAEVYV